MWPRPPAPMTTTRRARAEHRDRLLDRVDRGQARVGQRGDLRRMQRRVELDHRARAREQEVGEAAVAVDPGNDPFSQCMSSPRAARAAQPARDERMDDDRVADLDVRDRRADLVDPAGVLVAGRVGQLDLGLLRPLALLDVQVGAAQAGRADAHDRRRAGRWPSARRPRRASAASWYACSRAAFMPPPPPVRNPNAVPDAQQGAADARRWSRGRADEPRAAEPVRRSAAAIGAPPSPATKAGASAPAREAQVLAQLEAAPRVRVVGQVGDAPRGHLLGGRPAGEQRLAQTGLAGHAAPCAGTARAGVQLAPGLAGEGLARTRSPRATAALISSPV